MTTPFKPYEKQIGDIRVRVIGHCDARYPGEALSRREIVEPLTPMPPTPPKEKDCE